MGCKELDMTEQAHRERERERESSPSSMDRTLSLGLGAHSHILPAASLAAKFTHRDLRVWTQFLCSERVRF